MSAREQFEEHWKKYHEAWVARFGSNYARGDQHVSELAGALFNLREMHDALAARLDALAENAKERAFREEKESINKVREELAKRLDALEAPAVDTCPDCGCNYVCGPGASCPEHKCANEMHGPSRSAPAVDAPQAEDEVKRLERMTFPHCELMPRRQRYE